MTNLRMFVGKLNAHSMRFGIALDSLQRSRINCITGEEFNHWISSRWGLVQNKNVSPTEQIFNQRPGVVQFMPGRVSPNSSVANYLHLTTYSLAFQLRIFKLLSHNWSATPAIQSTIDRLYSRTIQLLTRQIQQSQTWPKKNNGTWHLHYHTKTSLNSHKIFQAGLLTQIIQNSANVVDSKLILRPQSKISSLLQEKPKSLNVLISVIGENKQIKLPNQRVNSHAVLTDNNNTLQWLISNKTSLYYSTKEMGLVHQLGDALKGLRESVDDQRAKSTATSALATPPHQIEQLTRRVYDQLKREIRIEKERRGL